VPSLKKNGEGFGKKKRKKNGEGEKNTRFGGSRLVHFIIVHTVSTAAMSIYMDIWFPTWAKPNTVKGMQAQTTTLP
jgi:hypothetical protein